MGGHGGARRANSLGPTKAMRVVIYLYSTSFIKGKVTVTRTDDQKPVTVGEGDFITFPGRDELYLGRERSYPEALQLLLVSRIISWDVEPRRTLNFEDPKLNVHAHIYVWRIDCMMCCTRNMHVFT